MKTLNRIDRLDEMLRLSFLASAQTDTLSNAEQYFQRILAIDPLDDMPASKKNDMLNRLQQVLAGASLGQLVQEGMVRTGITGASLAGQTGLPLTLLEDIQQDRIYTNNVPIILFKRLLKLLGISFSSANQAIRRSFELLQGQTSTGFQTGVSPSFKKGSFISKEAVTRNAPASDGKELFQNEEALSRYINRLEELMNE